MTHCRQLLALLGMGMLTLGGACARGRILDGGTGAAGTGAGTGTAGASGASMVLVVPPGGDPNGLLGTKPPPAAAFTPAPSTLRRLTTTQYRNTIADLLGAGVT